MASGSEASVSGLMKHARKKGRTVNLGAKGSFKIKHPGWTRAKAAAAGESTHQWAEEHTSSPGVTGARARSALGLMAMHKGK